MVTQKLISFKVDAHQLELLDDTCSRLGVNRNKFLNFLVSYANEMMVNSREFHILAAYSRALGSLND